MSLRRAAFALAAAACTACADGYRWELASGAAHPPTSSVTLTDTQPVRRYVEVGRFSGTELALCPPGEPYCSLRTKALQSGADVVWITQRRTQRREQQVVMIDGRATLIPAADTEFVEGRLLRYLD